MDKYQLVTEAINILRKQDANIDVKKAILNICLSDPEKKLANNT